MSRQHAQTEYNLQCQTVDERDESMTDLGATRTANDAWGHGIGRVAAPLRDQVLNAVRQAILDFELKPGDRLIERELMERLQVSRTTIRDVLARLGTEGLVTNVPQKGAIVTVITRDEAADIYEMRASLEPLAVRRFVERAGSGDTARLRAAAQAYMEEAARTQPADGLYEVHDALRSKDAFYEVLLAGAHSPRLSQVLSALQGQVQFLRATSLSVPGRSVEAAKEISLIVDAIEAGDAEAAAAACEAHVRNAAAISLAKLGDLRPA
jgi:DNA-binding GntR family transcriptional regulator